MNIQLNFEINPYFKTALFPGGEVFFKLTDVFLQQSQGEKTFTIKTRINNSNDLMLLVIAVRTIKDYSINKRIEVYLPYFPYAQADDDFEYGEACSLKYIAEILNSLPVDAYYIYDPHSSATICIKNRKKIDNRDFISNTLLNIFLANGEIAKSPEDYFTNKLVLLSPDAGAYKKIFKVADACKFPGQIETANKVRGKSGEPEIRLSCNDFHGKDVLIIDDICVGGGTFMKLASEIKLKNVRKIYLAVSHGVFKTQIEEEPAVIARLASYFDHIFTTNSRFEGPYDCKKVTIFKII